ncbi:PE family protein, partial [Mycobacterium simulans]|uniref:PE family protein n=1 Tax=Mycobacterium simulans TaxID=627089 RepID=UPI00174CE81D
MIVVADAVAAAGLRVADIGGAVSVANAAAVVPITEVVAAAEDEVSAAIAALFAGHGHAYQSVSAQAAAFHGRFVQALTAAGAAYGAAEATNVSPLQALERDILAVINAPTEWLFGRPLIGDGANGSTPGAAGEAGGFLIGKGGEGGGGAKGGGPGGAGSYKKIRGHERGG